MTSARGRWAGLALKALGLALLAQVLEKNRGPLREVLGHRPDLRLLALAVGLQLSAVVLTFLRWRSVVRAQGLPLGLGDAFRVGFVGNALDLVVPGQVGGDVVKTAFLCRGRGPKARAVASVVADRAAGLLGLFVLAAVMGAANWQGSPTPVRRLVVLVWAALLAGLLGLAAALTPALLRRAERLFAGRARLRPVAAELHAAGLAYCGNKTGVLLALLLSTASHTLYALAFTAVSFALLPDPPAVSQHLQMVPLVTFSTAAPLPFGALGLGEQVSDGLFAMLGHPSGALAMLGARLVALSAGCVSLVVYLWGARELRPTSADPVPVPAAPGP